MGKLKRPKPPKEDPRYEEGELRVFQFHRNTGVPVKSEGFYVEDEYHAYLLIQCLHASHIDRAYGLFMRKDNSWIGWTIKLADLDISYSLHQFINLNRRYGDRIDLDQIKSTLIQESSSYD